MLATAPTFVLALILAGGTGVLGGASSPWPAFMPLSLGATWAYDVSIDTADGGARRHVTGQVVRQVVAVSEHLLGPTIYLLHDTPLPASWLTAPSHALVAYEGALYELRHGPATLSAAVALLVASSEVRDDARLELGVSRTTWTFEDVVRAHGVAGCVVMVQRTMPHDTTDAYCPGLGLAWREYHHHGTLQDERWSLRTFRPR